MEAVRERITARREATHKEGPGPALNKLPSSPARFFIHFHQDSRKAVKLQSHLVKQANKLRFDAAVEQAKRTGNTALLAHYHNISAPGASTWKRVIPDTPLHTLTDAQFRIAARLNMGLRPYRTVLPDKCASCGNPDALKRDPWHHLSCNGHKRHELTLRHDTVAQAIYHHAHYAGAAVTREPAGLSTEDGKRPDLHIVIAPRSILTDVVVSHPSAPSHVDTARNRRLAVADHAAAVKRAKYTEVAHTQTADFLPFSVETHGGMAQGAEELIDQLAAACKDHLILPSGNQFANHVRSSIAIAIQRGNALAIQAGYSRAVKREGKRRRAGV
jgi:hypothetical protein